ncbi:MAG: T9SS type A sorting domain-containing protein [Bacteroidales bacterium]
MKKNIFLFFALIANVTVFAGLYRAGEITYKNLSGLTYEIAVTLYTDLLDSTDRPDIIIYWGDGTNDTIPRIEKIIITPFQSVKNTYIEQHTYPGPDTYIVSIGDSLFRTDGIVNIPNSGNTGFYIQSQITINPFLGVNNSPVFLNPPLDIAYIDSIFIYNPSAYDIDGDSISYKLIACGGIGMTGYTFPSATNIFALDTLTGDLLWDSPILVGDYNIAILIEEWRFGVLIGSVVRDIQIHVEDASGIESFSDSHLFNIFPNPTHDKLYINSKTDKWSLVEIIDFTGKTVLSCTLNNNQMIKIGEIPDGLYLLRLTGKKRTLTTKIIKE